MPAGLTAHPPHCERLPDSELEPASTKERDAYSVYVHMWYKHDELDNVYAHPIDGLKAVVDVGNMKIIEIEDQDDSIPVPMEENNYVHQGLPSVAQAIAALSALALLCTFALPRR
eukprot:SAG31_NODE_1437_length_8339_cov_26.148058_3_plen_115_part_00